MALARVARNTISYMNTAISACVKGWRIAVGVLQSVPAAGAGQLAAAAVGRTLGLLSTMAPAVKVERHSISYVQLQSVLARRSWERLLPVGLLSTMAMPLTQVDRTTISYVLPRSMRARRARGWV
jgi:hypothetical protein